MAPYPGVNWWRGNLRLHESKTSLIARFANLNGLKEAACEQYFQNVLGNTDSLTGEGINRLANALSEDLATIQTVLNESLSLGNNHDFRTPFEKRDDSVRYCEQCALIGYHSYIHEYPWLALCPFHGTTLQTVSSYHRSGAIHIRRCKTLAKLMQSTCPYWPKSGTYEFVPEDYESFKWLSSWTERVTKMAIRFSQKKIWSSSDRIFSEAQGYGHTIGQLHALEFIPNDMKRLFTEVEEGWGADIVYFPSEARQEVARLNELNIGTLILFYKRIAAYSKQPYRFVKETDLCRQYFKEHHQNCRCEWRREKNGFYTFWCRVPPDGYRYWNQACPHEVASELFELSVGRRLDALSRRHREEERLYFMRESEQLVKLGLVGFTPNANVSPYGFLYWDHQTWPCIEWIGTPWLNAVLDQVVQFEVQTSFESLKDWLDSLKAGGDPSEHTDACPSIRLSETEDGLVLVKWRRRV